MYYWVTVQAPYNKKDFSDVVNKLNTISTSGVGYDVEFILKIKKDDWQKIVEICAKYLINGTVIGESEKP